MKKIISLSIVTGLLTAATALSADEKMFDTKSYGVGFTKIDTDKSDYDLDAVSLNAKFMKKLNLKTKCNLSAGLMANIDVGTDSDMLNITYDLLGVLSVDIPKTAMHFGLLAGGSVLTVDSNSDTYYGVSYGGNFVYDITKKVSLEARYLRESYQDIDDEQDRVTVGVNVNF